MTLNTFGSGIFPITATPGKGFSRTLASRPSHVARAAKVSERKVFDHKQLKILILAQIKAGNISKNLLNRNNTVFMNSENSKTVDPCRLLLNLLDKVNLKKG